MRRLESAQLEVMVGGRYSPCNAVVDGLGTIGGGLIVLGSFGVSAPLLAIGIPLYGLSLLFLSTKSCYN